MISRGENTMVVGKKDKVSWGKIKTEGWGKNKKGKIKGNCGG